MQATIATQATNPETIAILQRELDSAWDEFFELGDEPWDVQSVAAATVRELRHQIEELGAVPH